LTVVGVVGHMKQFGLSNDAVRPLQAQLYRSLMQGGDAMAKSAPLIADCRSRVSEHSPKAGCG
jgi:hypothetical protein